MPRRSVLGISQDDEVFCLHYVKTGNASAALRLIRPDVKSVSQGASSKMKRPAIQARIQELRLKAEEATIDCITATKTDVEKHVRNLIELALTGKPVLSKSGTVLTNPKTGEPVLRVDFAAYGQGIKLLGDLINVWKRQDEQGGELKDMTDADLAALIDAALANPFVLELVARNEEVQRKVNEFQRSDAAARSGDAGSESAEAESVSAASQASGVPPGRLH